MALKPTQKQEIKIPDLESAPNIQELKFLQMRLRSLDLSLKNVWKPPTPAAKKKLEKAREDTIAQIRELAIVPPQVAKQFDIIAKRCSQYIQGAQQAQGWLYRGYAPESSTVTMDSFVAATWSTKSPRQPRDSEQELSQVYDQILKKQGFKALRLTSIFTSGDRTHAEYYGESANGIYIIVPVDDKSQMLWTARRDIELYGVEDVFMKGNLHMYQDEVVLAVKNSQLPEIHKTLWLGTADHFPVDFSFDRDSFDNLVSMVQGQFRRGNPLQLPEYMKKMKQPVDFVNVQKFMEYYKPRTGNWAEAISSKHEVCITGAYYAFRSNIFEYWMNNYFNIK